MRFHIAAIGGSMKEIAWLCDEVKLTAFDAAQIADINTEHAVASVGGTTHQLRDYIVKDDDWLLVMRESEGCGMCKHLDKERVEKTRKLACYGIVIGRSHIACCKKCFKHYLKTNPRAEPIMMGFKITEQGEKPREVEVRIPDGTKITIKEATTKIGIATKGKEAHVTSYHKEPKKTPLNYAIRNADSITITNKTEVEE